jgi:hypothetical protein
MTRAVELSRTLTTHLMMMMMMMMMMMTLTPGAGRRASDELHRLRHRGGDPHGRERAGLQAHGRGGAAAGDIGGGRCLRVPGAMMMMMMMMMMMYRMVHVGGGSRGSDRKDMAFFGYNIENLKSMMTLLRRGACI